MMCYQTRSLPGIEGLTDARPVCGPNERISLLEVDAAIGKIIIIIIILNISAS